MQRFKKLLLNIKANHLKILDIGGTIPFWKSFPDLYKNDRISITIVNINTDEIRDENLHLISGDACALPFQDNSFSVVHSNSVIEHVGHWREMERMAAEVQRLASCYFVQTPNMWFPIEPHFKLPFVHWLPEQTRASIVQATGRSSKFETAREATLYVQRISLLSTNQMRCLFPDAHIWKERYLGFTKSLVAERFPGERS